MHVCACRLLGESEDEEGPGKRARRRGGSKGASADGSQEVEGGGSSSVEDEGASSEEVPVRRGVRRTRGGGSIDGSVRMRRGRRASEASDG